MSNREPESQPTTSPAAHSTDSSVGSNLVARLRFAAVVADFSRAVLRSIPVAEPALDDIPGAFLGRSLHAFSAVQILVAAGLPDAASPLRTIAELIIDLAYIYNGPRDQRDPLKRRYKAYLHKHTYDLHERLCRISGGEDGDHYALLLDRLRLRQAIAPSIGTPEALQQLLKDRAASVSERWNFSKLDWAPTNIGERARIGGVAWIYDEVYYLASIVSHSSIGTLLAVMEPTPEGRTLLCEPFAQPTFVLLRATQLHLHTARLSAQVYGMPEADRRAAELTTELWSVYGLAGGMSETSSD